MTASPMSGGAGAVSASDGGASNATTTEHGSGAGPAIQNWPHVSFLELAALPTAVSCGRLHARNVLWEWKLGHLTEDTELLVSELLTNAVKASWLPNGVGLMALRILADSQRLVIEVWDHNPGDPKPRQADPESEGGRGFAVIQAIAHRWRYQRVSASLKVVWCELLIGDNLNGGRQRG
jgi:anti-sigma regulatory factor (Ser/Thr protein kinase)